MSRTFSDYLDRQDRENKDHLRVLMHLYERSGFKIADHLDDRKDPYFFVRKPNEFYPETDNLSFNGLRVYTRGKETIAYRCQNKEQTEPFGEAYVLDVRGMFKSLVKEGMHKHKVGKKIARYLIDEVLHFFVQSAEAEATFEPNINNGDKFGTAAVVGATGGNDYAASVQTPGIGSSAGR